MKTSVSTDGIGLTSDWCFKTVPGSGGPGPCSNTTALLLSEPYLPVADPDLEGGGGGAVVLSV